jgi:hypothetical protein
MATNLLIRRLRITMDQGQYRHVRAQIRNVAVYFGSRGRLADIVCQAEGAIERSGRLGSGHFFEK